MSEKESTPVKKTSRKAKKAPAKSNVENQLTRLEENLEAFKAATKEDFSRLKENMATKEDIARLENEQTQLKNGQVQLVKGQTQLFDMYYQLQKTIEANHLAQQKDTDRILTALDKHVVKDLQDLKTEKIMATARLDRHDKQLTDHEQRLRRVEAAPAVN